jgi:hypothetical protein
MTRFFGPQVSWRQLSSSGGLPTRVELSTPSAQNISLLTDWIVRMGTSVNIVANGSQFVLADRQLRVQSLGVLRMQGVRVAGSTGSSALAIESSGKAIIANCTFQNCVAHANAMGLGGLDSHGGAFHIAKGGALDVQTTDITGNVARDGQTASVGGAIYALGGIVKMESVNMERNAALRGGMASFGGAMCLDAGSTADVSNGQFVGNLAKEGGVRSGGGAVFVSTGSILQMRGKKPARGRWYSRLSENFAIAVPNQKEETRTSGGAVWLEDQSSASISETQVTFNSAQAGNGYNVGGAFYVKESSVLLVRSVMQRNTAQDGRSAKGGAMFIQSASAVISDNVVSDNEARGKGLSEQVSGGAIMAVNSTLSLSGGSILRNLAQQDGKNGFASGGAIALESSSSAQLNLTDIAENVAQALANARGGALSASGSSVLHLVGPSLRENRAAASSGGLAEGGGISLHSASLVASDADLLENSALAGSGEAHGGFLSISPPSSAVIMRSNLLGNTVGSGDNTLTQNSLGGAVYASSGGSSSSQISILLSQVNRNSALKGRVLSAGGALYLDSSVVFAFDDSVTMQNRVEGASAAGGAIWFAGMTSTLTRVRFENNSAFANGVDGSALGGAVFHEGISMQLRTCQLVGNYVEIGFSAMLASAGALYVQTGAGATLMGCELTHNEAGGIGFYQQPPPASADAAGVVEAAGQLRASAAMQIYSGGSLALSDCQMVDGAAASVAQLAWWWIVCEDGEVVLRNSVFRASASYIYDPCPTTNGVCEAGRACPLNSDYRDCGTPPPSQQRRAITPERGEYDGGSLLKVSSKKVDVVIRGCKIGRLVVDSVPTMGVVNSTFDPPLSWSLPMPLGRNVSTSTLAAGACGILIAGEELCDPRALCVPRATGGVQCSCTGLGLSVTPGMYPDGQFCTQKSNMTLLLQSTVSFLSVSKPTRGLSFVDVLLVATGETSFPAPFGMTMQRSPAEQSVSTFAQPAVFATIKDTQELDGHHVIWEPPPSALQQVSLNRQARKFSDDKLYRVRIAIECNSLQKQVPSKCAADGDTFETVVTTGTEAQPTSVTIRAQVQAMVSCDNSKVELIPTENTVPKSAEIRVIVKAMDVDNIPVSRTRGDIRFRWNNDYFPHNWESGSNTYVADVPADKTERPGTYLLTVTVHNGWANAVGGTQSMCVLLQKKVYVQSETTQIIIGASAGSAIGLILIMFAALLYKNRERGKDFIVSFLSFEFLLTCEFVFESVNLAGDGHFVWTLQENRSKGWVLPVFYAGCVFAALSGLFFLVSLGTKIRLFSAKLQTRVHNSETMHRLRMRRQSLGGKKISAEVAQHKGVLDIKEKFLEIKLNRHKYFAFLGLALLEDLPFGEACDPSRALLVGPWCSVSRRWRACVSCA